MSHDNKDEKIDYGTLHSAFMRAARSAVKATPLLGPFGSFRSTKDPQVVATENSVLRAFGLRLSGTEIIKHFPLPEGYSKEIFMREVLIVIRKACPLTIKGKRMQSDIDNKVKAIHTERRMKALDRIAVSGEDTLTDADLRYLEARNSVLSCITRSDFESVREGIFPVLDETTLNEVDRLARIIAFDLDRNHNRVLLRGLVDGIKKLREEAGLTQTGFETELEEKFGYTAFIRLRKGKQSSCGFNIVDRSAYTIETIAEDIYRKAEEIVDRGTKESVSQQDECKIQQDENKTQQVAKKDKSSIPAAILDFCFIPRSMTEIKNHIGYSDRNTVMRFINELLASGDLSRKIPDKPSSRYQKYVSVRKKKE